MAEERNLEARDGRCEDAEIVDDQEGNFLARVDDL